MGPSSAVPVNSIQGAVPAGDGLFCLGRLWSKQHNLFCINNEAMVYILNTRASRVPCLMQLLCNLLLSAVRFSFSFPCNMCQVFIIRSLMLFLTSIGRNSDVFAEKLSCYPLLFIFASEWVAPVACYSSNFSSHTFCIGAATVGARNGILYHLIQAMGCWRSYAYLLYIRTPSKALAAFSHKLA